MSKVFKNKTVLFKNKKSPENTSAFLEDHLEGFLYNIKKFSDLMSKLNSKLFKNKMTENKKSSESTSAFPPQITAVRKQKSNNLFLNV